MVRGPTWLVVRLLMVPKNSGASPVAPANCKTTNHDNNGGHGEV